MEDMTKVISADKKKKLEGTKSSSRKQINRNTSMASSRTSTSSSINFEADFDNFPAPPLMSNGSGDSVGNLSLASASNLPKKPLEHFDLIVIGMQEATFETEKSSKGGDNDSKDGDGLSDDGSLSASDDELGDVGVEVSLDDKFDFDSIDATYNPDSSGREEGDSRSGKKSTAKKMLGATLKAGKVGLKAGKAGLKAGKVGLKAGKAGFKAGKKVVPRTKYHCRASGYNKDGSTWKCPWQL